MNEYGSYWALVFNMDRRQNMRIQYILGYIMEMMKIVAGKYKNQLYQY